MNLLITGGLGFVGINLVRRLAESLPNSSIFAVDVLPVTPEIESYLSPLQERISIRRLDTRDRHGLLEICETEKITHIIHAAALTPSLEMEKSQPGVIMDVNLGGTINILHAFHQSGRLQKLILCSSTGVYDPSALPPQAKVTEDAPLGLDNLYSITKYSSELLGARTQELTGKPVAAVRFSSVYGPMERPTGARQNMSLMLRLKKAWLEQRQVCVFGSDITRDWIHTSDIASGLLGLLNAPAWNYPVYNLGAGKATLLSELMAAFSSQGLDIRRVEHPEEATLLFTQKDFRGALDLSRIQQDTGFSPAKDAVIDLKGYLNEI